jgi:hypothetical protein
VTFVKGLNLKIHLWNGTFPDFQAFDILQGQKANVLTDITSYENLHKPFNRFEHLGSRANTSNFICHLLLWNFTKT